MDRSSTGRASTARTSPVYDERWTAPPWVWAAGLTVAAITAATVHAGAGGARAVVPYVLLPALAVLVLLGVSRGRVRVVDGVLQVPGGRIPLDQLGSVRELDVEATRRVRGPLAQPRAFVASRAWLGRSVQVQVEDPDDDTPYWLVGSRHPDRLAAALRSR